MVKCLLKSLILALILFPALLCAQEIGDAEWAYMAYEKGQQHEADRDWQNALRMYKGAVERVSDSAIYRYRAAYAATQLKQSREAYALLEPTTSQKHAPSWNLFARLLLDRGKITQSKEWLQKALMLEPGNPEPYFGLALCAEESLKTGDASAKSDAIAYYQAYLGRATDGGRREDAQARVRELQHGKRGIALNRAIRVLSVGEYDRAEEMLQELAPNIKEAIYWLGVVAQNRGNISVAQEYWTRSLPLPIAQLALARQLMADGRYADALPYLQNARRRAPNMVEVNFALGRVYLELGQRQEAEEWLRRVVRDSPQHPEALRAQELLHGLDAASPQQEPDWSSTMLTEAQLLQRYGGELHDPALLARLEAIIKRLQAGTPELSYRRFHLRILGSSVLNAWPAPPNSILITRGLIQFVDTCPELGGLADDALAFILGHEITHLVEHDTERAGELQALTGDDLVDFQVRQAILHRTEYNADRRGTLMAYQAQFDPFAACIWYRASRDRYGDIPGVSGHPTFGQRMIQVRQFLLEDLMEAHGNFKQGVALLQRGDAMRAASAFEMYLAQLPTDTEARYNLALAYFLQGIAQLPTPSWAPWQLANEVAVEPLFPEPDVKGIARPNTIDTEANKWLVRARSESEQLLRQNKTHVATWRLIGDIALAYRDLTSAHRNYSEALRIHPGNAAALNNMAVLACLEKRWAAARQLLSECITSDTSIADIARRNLGQLPG